VGRRRASTSIGVFLRPNTSRRPPILVFRWLSFLEKGETLRWLAICVESPRRHSGEREREREHGLVRGDADSSKTQFEDIKGRIAERGGSGRGGGKRSEKRQGAAWQKAWQDKKKEGGRKTLRAVTSKLWLDTGCQSEIVPDGA
jgi:hypothetical protein